MDAILHFDTNPSCYALKSLPPWPGSPLADVLIVIKNETSQKVTLYYEKCASSVNFNTSSRQVVQPGDVAILPNMSARLIPGDVWSYVAIKYGDAQTYDVHALVWDVQNGYYFATGASSYQNKVAFGTPTGGILSISTRQTSSRDIPYPWTLNAKLLAGVKTPSLPQIDRFASV